jgi:hypothetical protein
MCNNPHRATSARRRSSRRAPSGPSFSFCPRTTDRRSDDGNITLACSLSRLLPSRRVAPLACCATRARRRESASRGSERLDGCAAANGQVSAPGHEENMAKGRCTPAAALLALPRITCLADSLHMSIRCDTLGRSCIGTTACLRLSELPCDLFLASSGSELSDGPAYSDI